MRLSVCLGIAYLTETKIFFAKSNVNKDKN